MTLLWCLIVQIARYKVRSLPTRRLGAVLAVALAFSFLYAAAAPAFAHRAFLLRLRNKQKVTKENGKCILCHDFNTEKTQSDAENLLGKFGKTLRDTPDLKSLLGKAEDYKFSEKELLQFDAALKSVEDKDDDEDGATNKEELALGTLPGDPRSMPTSEALAEFRKKK